MDTQLIKKIEEKHTRRDVDVRPGDTVKVHLKITEGGKERTQVFEGVVIAVKGSGISKTFTVRKVSYGVGVEKILPVNSPLIKKIDVVERGKVRRSKLYYMRSKVGKRSLDVQLDKEFKAIYGVDEEELAKEKAAEEAKAKEGEEEGGEEKEEAKEEKPEKPEKKEEKPAEKKEDKPAKAEKPAAEEKKPAKEDSKKEEKSPKDAKEPKK